MNTQKCSPWRGLTPGLRDLTGVFANRHTGYRSWRTSERRYRFYQALNNSPGKGECGAGDRAGEKRHPCPEKLSGGKSLRVSQEVFLNYQGEPISERGIRKLVVKYRKEAGITKKASCHTLRHTFATYKAEKGVSAFQLQQWLGHANLNTTQIYVHLGKQNARKIMQDTSLLRYRFDRGYRYRLTNPPKALLKARMDNIAIVPASMLPLTHILKEKVNTLPKGGVFLCYAKRIADSEGFLNG